MKKKLAYIAIGLLTATTYGCGDFLDEYSQDMSVPETVSDLDEVLIGEVYIKSKEVARGMTSSNCAFFNLLDDDINTVANKEFIGDVNYDYTVKSTFGYYAWQQDVRYNYGAGSKTEDDATWNNLYRRIAIANVILDEIEGVPHETDTDHASYLRVKGEAHFLRAQFYFILANLYGDAYAPATAAAKPCVPLKLTPEVEYDKEKPTQFQRATVKEVYDQIVSDLLAAEEYLTESPQNEKRRLHRATWEAVDLLLSRVYLYMQDWENAEKKAKLVMGSKNFALSSIAALVPETPFLTKNNREIIFSQGSNYVSPGSSTAKGWSVTGKSADYCVSRDLYDLYSDDDARKTCFFSVYTATDSIALEAKYERTLVNDISDALALRMSEAYLNYAEACAMQPGKESEANTTLTYIREQRIQGYTAQDYTGEELVSQVRLERRKELCFEGKRWFDLRRYAVCTTYPYSKDILHTFAIYNNKQRLTGVNHYLLPAGDKSYTFGIPRTALDFDKEPMEDNPRDKREPLEKQKEEGEEAQS